MPRLAILIAFVLISGTAPAQVFINEFLSDPNNPALSPAILDANIDGAPSSADDEFVEIVNAGAIAVDISGWTLADFSATRHVFPATTTLPPGAAIVVFGGGNLSAFNASGNGFGVGASTGFLGLNNAGDTITLAEGNGTVVDSVTYIGAPSPDNGDGVAVNRAGDAAGALFDQHDLLAMGGLRASPGSDLLGSGFAAATFSAPVYSYPGSGADLGLDLRLNGVLTPTATGTIPLQTGDFWGLRISSPQGSLIGSGFVLAYTLYSTGSPPAGTVLGGTGGPPSVWLDLMGQTFVALDGLNPIGILSPAIAPFGFEYGPFVVPANLVGMNISANFQAFANLGAGVFGSSDALAIDAP